MDKSIDFILTGHSSESENESVRRVLDNSIVNKVFLTDKNGVLQTADGGEGFPLGKEGKGSIALLKYTFRNTSSPYIALYQSASIFEPGYRCLERMVAVAADTGAAMVYADHYDQVDGKLSQHPLIDYQKGSVRDDFDFGGLWLIRRDLVGDFINEQNAEDYRYAATYALRLYLSRVGNIFHIKEFLYTERRNTSLRKSGEMQFDYVNPANKDVQFENECAFTRYLKETGAWLPPEEMDDTVDNEGLWPVMATVVIPVRNRAKTIGDAVKSVLSQKASFSFNVIVVDNHSTDGTGTEVERLSAADNRVVLLHPKRTDLGIGGCWDLAIRDSHCGRYAVQLDSDDLYSGDDTLQTIVDKFEKEKAAMVIGSYRIVDFDLNTLPPGLISHSEWTHSNGRNNALRINGLGAPRAFRTAVIREIGFPNTSYGEDYAVGLAISRRYKISRIYDELYLCRRWDGNSDSNISIEKQNKNNSYKDSLRTAEIEARRSLIKQWNRPISEDKVNKFFRNQMSSWQELEQTFENLKTDVQTKPLESSDGTTIAVQWNPKRIVSTGAKIDKSTLSHRPCFLCDRNRPAKQHALEVEGQFQVLVNPFPILPGHLTLPSRHHVPQRFTTLFPLMCKAIEALPSYLVFYNGPHCGASAPDHAHLQAGLKGKLPIERDWNKYEERLTPLYCLNRSDNGGCQTAMLARVEGYACPAFAIIYKNQAEANILVGRLLKNLPTAAEPAVEPDFNAIGWQTNAKGSLSDSYCKADGHKVMVFFPRRKHRPECYYAEGEMQTTVSPGSVDMGGLIITPREADYKKMTYRLAASILKEVAVTEEQADEISNNIKDSTFNGGEFTSTIFEPSSTGASEIEGPTVSVGIMSGEGIEFKLNGEYSFEGRILSGNMIARATASGIEFQGKSYGELQFAPVNVHSTFTLKGVTIGINFHWQRNEAQEFGDKLKIICNGGKLMAINVVAVEEYLKSVISSEMKATASLELLKSHAIISRSWLLCQMGKRRKGTMMNCEQPKCNCSAGEYVKWYDRDDHVLFDVCSDDHCQRYQGITREISDKASLAVDLTRGLVLSNEGKICDARFSKCCGGITEEYATCWEDKEVPFLKSVCDNEENKLADGFNSEDEVEDFINNDSYDAFCNTQDRELLSQVLNDYDTETRDFFRWQVSYSQSELGNIVREKTGIDLGDIRDLIPLKRGKSGRIWLLEIVGTKHSIKIGKELEIRRVLSTTHLYSSAFIVHKGDADSQGLPKTIQLQGAGWGHGAGLCQIGAAVMGAKGYSCRQILEHYYKNTDIDKLY